MYSRQSVVIQTVRAAVQDRLETGVWQRGQRLPSLAAMAEMLGVSRSTMWRALGLLKKDSLVHATHRGAIFAGPPGTPRLVRPERGRVWERLKARIGRDILAGEFDAPRLPPASKLALHYDVSVPTLSKALAALVDEGALIARGHRYHLPPKHSRYHLTNFVLIAGGPSADEITVAEDRAKGIVESLERECVRRSFGHTQVGFNAGSPGSLLAVQRTLDKLPETTGFIVNMWTPWESTARARWFDLLHLLAARRLPLVVIDQSGNLDLPPEVLRDPRVRLLRIAGLRAGEMVADMLLRTKHSRIAYIAGSLDAHWVRDRYEGLMRYVKQYGRPGAEVELHVQGELSEMADPTFDLLGLAPPVLHRIFEARFGTQGADDVVRRASSEQLRVELDFSDNDPKVLMIRSAARHLDHLASGTCDREVYEKLFDAMYDRASTYALELYLRPFVDRALKATKATAWVCSDDKVALLLLPCLAMRKIEIPRTLSVVGFNNWDECYEKGLTSHDFNMDGMVREAMLMIQDEKYRKSAAVVREVDGYVVERGTTKR